MILLTGVKKPSMALIGYGYLQNQNISVQKYSHNWLKM